MGRIKYQSSLDEFLFSSLKWQRSMFERLYNIISPARRGTFTNCLFSFLFAIFFVSLRHHPLAHSIGTGSNKQMVTG